MAVAQNCSSPWVAVLLLCQVEMFVLSTPEQSNALHQELIGIEQELYSELGLHFKVRATVWSTLI